MKTETYVIIRPIIFHRKKRVLGEPMVLTESQARPLCQGGFVTPDRAAAQAILELVHEHDRLNNIAENDEVENTTGAVE